MDLLQEENNQEMGGKQCSSHHSNLRGKDDEEEPIHDDMTVPRKFHYCSKWRHDQDAVHWVKLKKAQYLRLHFWQTKSNAIIGHNPVPPECIFQVIARNGQNVIYERLSTPRPSPKVVLRSS